MSVDFKVEGFEELFKQMDDLSKEIGTGKTDRIWRKALAEAMQPVLDMARTLAPGESPSSTGQLKQNIYMKAHKPQARDKRSIYYDGEMFMARVSVSPIREDSKKGAVLNKRGKFQTVWQNIKPVAISQEFGNKHLQNSEFGTAAKGAHPFLRPALENNVGRVQTRLGYAIMDAIDKLVAKKG